MVGGGSRHPDHLAPGLPLPRAMEAPVQRGGAASIHEGIEPLSIRGSRGPDREADTESNGQDLHGVDAN
jgi:hypothetical protein